MESFRLIERNLLALVIVATVVGLSVPQLGVVLSGAVPWMLALLMLAVSLTFDVATVRRVFRRPSLLVLATVLVYGPMSLVGFGLATAIFGEGTLWMGMILLAVLPTDVSSPLLVWIGRGNVALATVCNALNTALAPLLVPGLFLLYTGVALDMPFGAIVGELAAVVLLPTLVGVAIRTWQPLRISRIEPVLSASGSLSYLALLIAVVGPNAPAILAEPTRALTVVVAGLALNVAGYLIALVTCRAKVERADQVAMLFTVSKKEFSIAAFVVFSTGLPAEVALPAVIYAVVQMVTSPIVARRAAASSDR